MVRDTLPLTLLLILASSACSQPASGTANATDQGTSGEDVGDASTSGAESSGGEASSGADESTGGEPYAPHRSCLEDSDVIGELPPGSERYAAEGFTQYTELSTPNGGSVGIYAQAGVNTLAIYRARNLLRFFLTDVADTMYGTDKGAVANAMADNGAVLVMPEGAHEEGNEPNVPAQPLYEAETPVDGSAWYVDNDFEHRDAALEEIFHLVHDTGIGTDFPGALPDYQAALLAEAQAAIQDGRWGIPVDPQVGEWIEELEAEGSLAQEYIASVIDSYYGLWGPWTEAPGGMWGVYIAKTRDEVYESDAAGAALLEHFLPPVLDYEARLDPAFSGSFQMQFEAAQPYTHKSQYLVQVTLTGSNDAGIVGNAQDNTLRGNAGNNALDGGDGDDLVVYCEAQSAYAFEAVDGGVQVSGPDGTDTLRNVERVHFADGVVEVDALLD